MNDLAHVAPAFVQVAHRIVWATVATVHASGQPRTRVLHPLWQWDGHRLTGWVATDPASPKAADLAHESRLSLTYWSPEQDTVTADCDSTWLVEDAERQAAWDRFSGAPEPVGYDPSIIPKWTSAQADAFGVLELTPTWLRVFPGSLLLRGEGDLLTWRA
ncbi:MAG: pyridoxamine 5'-phosphate oxidase family protein [Ornithinimicrobium sp.]